MSTPAEDELKTTVLFCRSDGEGALRSGQVTDVAAEIARLFPIGGVVADRYHVIRHLGSGGMGNVFLATDSRLNRPVAVKVVPHGSKQLARLESVLKREAQLGANLSHRGIASVYDFGMNADASFTVFEFVEGQTLRQLMNVRRTFPLEETAQVIQDLSAALDYAHLHGVVHRDLKPENVCFTKSGECKILDLGLARDVHAAVVAGEYSGTPAYSSPEQAQCEHTDARTDQYALALIAFEMLTGRRAFDHRDPRQLLALHVDQPSPPLRSILANAPRHAERALSRALSKHPDDRFTSCHEFAQVLSEGVIGNSGRHNVLSATAARRGFYIAHAAEDSVLARRISEQLASHRYSTWYYGRDAIPGVPFTDQAREAIEHSQATLLVMSSAAAQSPDFEREIEHAFDIGSPILPLLVDLSREEFEKLAPAWHVMLRSTGMTEYRRSEPLDNVITRILAAAERLHISHDTSRQQSPPQDSLRCIGQIWATDANQIDILDTEHVLYRTSAIDEFLHGRHRHFISASKGFGKTLLLTRKRDILTRGSSEPVTMIPEDRPYLDFMSEMRTLSVRQQKALSSVSAARRLWNAAFRISALSHFPGVITEYESADVALFPERIQRWIRGMRIPPSVVFKEFATLNVSEVNRVVDQTETFLDHKLRQIHSGLIFFVDKVDQAISHVSRDTWIAVQAGLIEAAWEIMNANSHVKVFASIRQEAFSNYQSHTKANLFAATTSLSYSESELQALLDQLAQCYEGCHSFVQFLGHRALRHARRPVPEDSFQYVRRHTLGRPRDIVALASSISAQRSILSEKRLREVVQQTSSDVVASNIFDEVSVFLNCLADFDARNRFFRALPGNILDKSDACRACEVFNGLEPGSLQHFGEESLDIFHPFRDLYFAGLLGIVVRDPTEGILQQRFRRPHDPWSDATAHIPDSGYYLLHPALDTHIRQHRSEGSFLQVQHVPVGDGLIWRPHFATLIQIEKQLHKLTDSAFVELAHRFLKRAQALFLSDRSELTVLALQNGPQWKSLREYENRPLYADACLWLIELLEELRAQ